MTRSRAAVLAFSVMLGFAATGTNAAPTIWGNDQGTLKQWDLNGNLLRSIPAPHGGTGRGIAQVGNILYYTGVFDNNVYKYDLLNNLDLGVAFTVSSAPGLMALAWDGGNFWIGKAGWGNNVAVEYSPSGVLLNTITLANCTGYCDGLEYANGKLISNREDGGLSPNTYDIYNLNGTLNSQGFIVPNTASGHTGITFDGLRYYISNIKNHSIGVYDNTGTHLYDFNLSGISQVEDLSMGSDQGLVVCKVAGPGVALGTPFSFNAGAIFTIPAGAAPAGSCVDGPPIVPGATVVVTEQIPLGYVVSNIIVTPAGQVSTAPDLSTGAVGVMIGAGVTKVTYTNVKASGYIEICKKGDVRGNFTFTLNSGGGGQVVVPAGACSPAIEIPAGQVVVTEAPNPSYGLLSCLTFPPGEQGACNLAAQTSTVTVRPGGISTQTVAIITNASRGK